MVEQVQSSEPPDNGCLVGCGVLAGMWVLMAVVMPIFLNLVSMSDSFNASCRESGQVSGTGNAKRLAILESKAEGYEEKLASIVDDRLISKLRWQPLVAYFLLASLIGFLFQYAAYYVLRRFGFLNDIDRTFFSSNSG